MKPPAGRARPAAAGFTLIELMVVVLLVGLVVSFAVISVGGDSALERQKREAQRLHARMDLAREEAVLQARSLGVRFSDDGYRFFELRRDQWRPLGGDGVLARRSLPDAVSVDVEVDGLEVSLTGDEADGDGTRAGEARAGQGGNGPPVRPQIFFLPGGEIVPAFTINVLSADTLTEFRIAPGDERWLALSEHEF